MVDRKTPFMAATSGAIILLQFLFPQPATRELKPAAVVLFCNAPIALSGNYCLVKDKRKERK